MALTEVRSISHSPGHWFAETELPLYLFYFFSQKEFFTGKPSEEQTSTKAQNLTTFVLAFCASELVFPIGQATEVYFFR